MNIEQFQKIIWEYYKKHKRSFPWRGTTNPYRILVSEIMLQQTQADRVVEYYKKFLKRFPNFQSLAKADFKDIYPYWQGLGYNRRAMMLKKSAEKVITECNGKLPKNPELLETFPGVGPYTARAVSIFSHNTPVACIETNIRRVFIHHFFEHKGEITDQEILKIAEAALPKGKSREWHWALMDYGAYLKTAIPNPNKKHAKYSVQSKFEGSLRQIRGVILKTTSVKPSSFSALAKLTSQPKERTKQALDQLIKEGLMVYNKRKKLYSLL